MTPTDSHGSPRCSPSQSHQPTPPQPPPHVSNTAPSSPSVASTNGQGTTILNNDNPSRSNSSDSSDHVNQSKSHIHNSINSQSNSPNTNSSSSSNSGNGDTSESRGAQISHSNSNQTSSSPTGFECNICIDIAALPVVTQCGHLYCWKCLHGWLKRGGVDCPVCKAGVTEDNIIPIYVGGNSEDQNREGGSATKSPHPASKEGRELAAKLESAHQTSGIDGDGGAATATSLDSEALPHRPRAQRPQPSSTPGSTGATRGRFSFTSPFGFQQSTGTSVHFGLFPFGVGIQFGSLGVFGRNGSRRPTAEEQRAQLISTVLIFLGLLVTFWAVFIGPSTTAGGPFYSTGFSGFPPF